MASALSRRHVTWMLKSGHVTGWSPGRWPAGCAFPSLCSGWGSSWLCGWLPLPPGTNQLVDNGDLFLRIWVTALFQVVKHWRWATVVLRDAFMEAPLSPLYLCGITVWTLDLVHYTCPFVLGSFVLGLNQVAPDGVIRFEVHRHSGSLDGSVDSVCEVPHIQEFDFAFVPGGAGVLGAGGRCGFCSGNLGGLDVSWHTQNFLEVVYHPKCGLLAYGVASVM